MSAPNFPISEEFFRAVKLIAAGVVEIEPERCVNIGSDEDPLAWRLIMRRDDANCIYLHRWLRSDPDDLHDHPWDFVSVIVDGGYWEVTEAGSTWRDVGSIAFRKATDRHRVELDPISPRPTSLIITGPVQREWGYHTTEGFVIGRDYRSKKDRA